jgi:phospholipid N-methyltransferase
MDKRDRRGRPPTIIFAENPAAAKPPARTVACDLFPTSSELAGHMAGLARLRAGQRVLEPSAGTGRLIDAAGMSAWGFTGELIAVESNPSLAQALLFKYGHLKGTVKVAHADFLTCGDKLLGRFDRILMVPPRAKGADLQHVMHATKFLYRGGCLVGLISTPSTPAFRSFIESMSGVIEPLPVGAFKEATADGNACLVMIEGK